jgi:hypothetical protein
MLTANVLGPVLRTNAPLVDEALQSLGDGANAVKLMSVQATAELMMASPESILIQILERRGLTEGFLAYLRGHGLALLDQDHLLPNAAVADPEFQPFGVVEQDGFDMGLMAKFILRAKAFRCRILLDGDTIGSGALISPRLVLTAAHVVEGVDPARRLEVLGDNGRRYLARVAFTSPCHPDEHLGQLPPAAEADAYADVALLRLTHPLGRKLAAIDLPDAATDWQGTRNLILVHFPKGEDRGGSLGRVARRGAQDIRLQHDIRSEGGSSGGPGFDTAFSFVGLHQGRLANGETRRLVPYDRFASNADFRAIVADDRALRGLWSLDDTPDGHLILGRDAFFDAITAMVGGQAPMARGLWIRRSDPTTVTGLGFSHQMLTAFLRAVEAKVDLHRVATEQMDRDLVAKVHGVIFGDAGLVPTDARPGVRADETTQTASDEDRVRSLLTGVERRATETGHEQWIYFDNPPEGLSQAAQFQLEHLVRGIMRRTSLRIILAGYETYGLLETRYDRLDDALAPGARPGLVIETLRGVSERDVAQTVTEMVRALGIDWGDDVILREVARALRGLTLVGGLVPPALLGEVASRLTAEIRASVPQ